MYSETDLGKRAKTQRATQHATTRFDTEPAGATRVPPEAAGVLWVSRADTHSGGGTQYPH